MVKSCRIDKNDTNLFYKSGWEDWDSNPRTTKDRILSPAELASFPILPLTLILILSTRS